MFCIIAFVVLGILGIFSATNRALAKEALDCVLRRVTLRPCNTGFDEKMKAKILGSIITRSETAARVINKNFELLSWTFFILMLASSVWAVRGVYLFYVTGSCNGLNQAAFCVFDPKGQNNQVSDLAAACPVKPATEKDLTLSGVDLSGFPVINPAAKDKIVFIGCYSCDYSRKAYPMVMDLVRKTGASFTLLHYPVKEKTDFMSRVGYCTYLQDQDKYWMVNDAFFTMDRADMENETAVRQLVAAAGDDPDKVFACVNDPQTEVTVQKMLDEITKTKFFGTPTVFINGKPLVGPKPYRVYAIMVQGLFYWLK